MPNTYDIRDIEYLEDRVKYLEEIITWARCEECGDQLKSNYTMGGWIADRGALFCSAECADAK